MPAFATPTMCSLTLCVMRELQVSMAVDEDGVVHYSRGIKRFNLRGTQYSIPLPKGGRRNTDIILCEDQLLRNRKPKPKADDLFDAAAAGFAAVGVAHSENARCATRAAPCSSA